MRKIAKTKEFRLFLTVWIIYIFYLQVYGSSTMANTQSALTAAIVNEGRFEIDTYYRTGGQGNAFYNGHYYSGQAPGISFISVPLYALSKPVFHLLPQKTVDSLFGDLEAYGKNLPKDFEGKEKILSNYFPGLNKRQILEYIVISSFILPIFTTALFSAMGVVLVYVVACRFTRNENLRMLTALFYAFGTILFPLSTEFFERPIAITLIFAAFIVLFRVRHYELKSKSTVLFLSGLLAGFSIWFDYFNFFSAGLLFLYLMSFFVKHNNTKKFKLFTLDKSKLLLPISFLIGTFIPIFLLLSYHYIVFDDPFTTSYAQREFQETVFNVSGILNASIPDASALFHMLAFLIYSPIIILALYGFLRSLKRDKYYHDVLAIGVFVAFTLTYASALMFAYSHYPLLPESFKRYMTPVLPFIFIFLPRIFPRDKFKDTAKKTMLFGAISIFLNWVSAQYGGHWALSHFDLNEKKFLILSEFFENGPSSSFLRTLAGVADVNALLLNLIGLTVLILIVYVIWKPNHKLTITR
jgi:hypothetical protein